MCIALAAPSIPTVGQEKSMLFPAEPGMMIQGGRHGYTRKFKMHMEDFKKKRFLQSTILLRFLPYFPGNFGAGPWDPMGFCLQTVPTQVVLCFARRPGMQGAFLSNFRGEEGGAATFEIIIPGSWGTSKVDIYPLVI